MLDSPSAFITPAFLRSVWEREYAAWRDSPDEAALLARLRDWSARADLGETSAEPAFIQQFFRETWGYTEAGQASGPAFTLWPKFPVQEAGAGGGMGKADLAMGYFGAGDPVPQVLCEYKGVRTNLDAPQKGRSNDRSPVRQALDYLAGARRGFVGSEPVLPTWAVVSNMNEFRLYWYDRGASGFVSFVVRPAGLFDGEGLLAATDTARFNRFLFARLFHRDTLLTPGGKSALLRLIGERRFRDRKIEEEFYGQYRRLRDRLYTELLARNGPGTPRFPGTKGSLVRLAQKILDRLLFAFFCDDMGQRLDYPAKTLQRLLASRANDEFFDPNGLTVWQDVLALFRAMNAGTAFGGQAMHRFNGGLFAPDPVLEAMQLPNGLFCQHNQGQNEASIASHPETVLFLCATYNYAADLGGAEAGADTGRNSLGLYTLGRIFEQSITELEILEAEADGRPSVNKASQRKRDGVYYTPEWVVEQVVNHTLEPCFMSMRAACGWTPGTPGGTPGLPKADVLDAYMARLRGFTVLDPACGSGAFLITALRRLAAEWMAVRAVRRQVAAVGEQEDKETPEALLDRLMRDCIHGVDINPASVEIAQLALWLHTARRDRPLSNLAATVVTGNSLVTDDYYRGGLLRVLDNEGRERVNAFDWRTAFPDVAARGGFDAVVGNPPYVKLQNYKPAHPDVAAYLRDGRPGQPKPYGSTQTGNFDLYLPFIERGLDMLNPGGRLGYIAPSLWPVNDYGEGLRGVVARGRHLDRWLDFRSFQVFEEATTYTALQFYTKAPAEAVRVAFAPRGVVPPDPWADPGQRLPWGEQAFGDRWLLLTGPERALVNRLDQTCRRLDDPAHTRAIFTGLQTSADDVFHLRRLGPGRYQCQPPKPPGARDRPAPYEVALEDAVMRPLVSGSQAKRYCDVQAQKWLLFPYRAGASGMELIPPATFQTDYPKAWAYLNSYKVPLEMREAKVGPNGIVTGPVYSDEWYGFVYPKSLDKAHLPKLIVAQTVPTMRVCYDYTGEFAPNNVRVNGILPAAGQNAWFLLGILNARVADWVFRRIAKPKDGGWFEANKQFIAPLPIPHASPTDARAVADGARALQRLHSGRSATLARIARRLGTLARRARPVEWLFPGLGPAPLPRDTARAAYDVRLAALHDALAAAIRPGVDLDATLDDGELRFLAGGVPALDRIFVTQDEGPFLLAQWKVLASTMPVTESTTGKKLADMLRTFALPGNPAVTEAVIALAADLQAGEASIATAETDMNRLTYRLYGLTPAEVAMVEAG